MRSGRDLARCAATLALLACTSSGADGADATHGLADGGMRAAADAAQSAGPWSALEERPCPPHGELSYESFGAPFFASWCQGCHGSARGAGERQGAPPQLSFGDLDAVRAQAAAIWRSAGDDNATMPPVGGPAPGERVQLGQWLACGAPARADLD